tara:strand:+ start:4576 stop:5127 length:552 start_codon:yes stop_codon:yes gene_type:complete
MKNFKFFKKRYSLKRINLEKLSLKHLKDIHEYSKDKRFFKYFEYQRFEKISQTKKYIISKLKEVKKIQAFWWSIKMKNSGKIIGTICIQKIDISRRTCELGCGINPNYWNNGYFTEVLKYLSKIVVRKNRFLRCQCIVPERNYPSLQVLIKCGFKKEGLMKNALRDNNRKKSFNAVMIAKTIK